MSLLLLVAVMLAQSGFVPGTAEERYVADLRERIAMGDVEAEVTLGNLYEAGDVLPQDPTQAAEWYRRAADKGHTGAQLNLAMMYFDGAGVPRDIAQAVTLYQKAAASGEAIASFSLGSIYETGADSIRRDDANAAMWYRKAAEEGLGTAQYRLALMYRNGRGVSRNITEAIAWLRKAADRGEADAQIELGLLLSPGNDSSDIVEAHTWFNLAASRWKDEAKRVQAAALRDELETMMTSDQRAAAYRRATEWQDAHSWQRQSAAKPAVGDPQPGVR